MVFCRCIGHTRVPARDRMKTTGMRNMPEQNESLLMHHLVKMSSLSGRRPDQAPNDGEEEKVRMTEHRIYVGLNDSQTRQQRFDTDRYKGILKDVCRSYHAAFSVAIEEGGYYHDDGEYTEETSLVLALIDTDPVIVREIAKDLCVFFRQESVLVTETLIGGQFIREEITKDTEPASENSDP